MNSIFKSFIALMCLLSIVCLVGVANAQEPPPLFEHQCNVTDKCGLTWDLNVEPDMKAYRLYWSLERGQYVMTQYYTIMHPLNSLGTVNTLLKLPIGVYYFALTAVDTSDNVSGLSDEVMMNVTSELDITPPAPPTGLTATITIAISTTKSMKITVEPIP